MENNNEDIEKLDIPSETAPENFPEEPSEENIDNNEENINSEYDSNNLKAGFGRNEFAKTVNNKNYYKEQGDELRRRQEQARIEKNLKQKKAKDDDSNDNKNEQPKNQLKNKNILDKASDNANLAKANLASAQNKINSAKAKAYQAKHPIESAKANLTEEAKKRIFKFLLSHPYIILILGLLILLFIILFIVFTSLGMDDNLKSSLYSENCGAISMASTSLDKSEFVSLLQDYASKQDSHENSWKIFSDNAANIYDIAVKNGINPELVVVRAKAEGFSPGGSTNNYWGLGSYNGSSSSLGYSSFSEGVVAFAENISQYDSVESMMSKYAYIGSYWYNPGGAGLGGCYYYPSIKEYLSEARAKEVASFCGETKCPEEGGAGCNSTTAEDQEAYSKYQVKTMVSFRKMIFGIDEDVCISGSPGCTIYAQGDPKWSSINLGSSAATMGDAGCAVTSLAIGISCSGTDLTIDNFDAGVFINKLNDGACFAEGGNLKWACSAIQSIAPGVSYVKDVSLSNKSVSEKISIIEENSTDTQFVLLHLYNSDHKRGHFVVYSSTNGTNLVVKDPGTGKTNTYKAEDMTDIRVYKYTKGTNIADTSNPTNKPADGSSNIGSISSYSLTNLTCGMYYGASKLTNLQINNSIQGPMIRALNSTCEYLKTNIDIYKTVNISTAGTYNAGNCSTSTPYPHCYAMGIDLFNSWTFTYNGKTYTPYSSYGDSTNYRNFICDVCKGKENCRANLNYWIYQEAFKKENFCWGGFWGESYFDPMHYEYNKGSCSTSSKINIKC